MALVRASATAAAVRSTPSGPTADGRLRPAAERADIYWTGADEPWALPDEWKMELAQTATAG